MGHPQMLVRW
uniref:Uncharacterized protein n=1 Tax=Arundo donax TaxID=35708 RepID=A0A0A9BWC4_ARUDO